MKCENFIAKVDEIAVNDPNVSLTPELREHLDCESCRKHYEELVDAWLLLADGLDRHPVRPELEDRVMHQVAIARSLTFANTTIFRVCKYALAACVLIALTLVTMNTANLFGGGRQDRENLARVKDLARQMGRIRELEAAFSNPEIKYVSLTSGSNRVGGYLVHDVIASEAHFFCFNLPTTQKNLKLWLLDQDGVEVASKTVDVSPDGLGASLVKIPADADAINEAVLGEPTSESNDFPPASGILLRVTVGS